MPRYEELNRWVGRYLFEVELDEAAEEQQPAIERQSPRWIWLLIGFAGGYFSAALVAALYWGWLP